MNRPNSPDLERAAPRPIRESTPPHHKARNISPLKNVDVTPLGRIPLMTSPPKRIYDDTTEDFKNAMKKLSESAWKFNRERDGGFLKSIENKRIDKEIFRQRIRVGLNCKLNIYEMDALFPCFNNEDMVDGCEFTLLLYKLRFDHRAKILSDRIEAEKIYSSKEQNRELRRLEEIEAKNQLKVSSDWNETHKKSILSKITEAAVIYDRTQPGTVQLDAFECEFMPPEVFREQLRRVFNIPTTPEELGAIISFLANNSNGDISRVNCAQFLVWFFRVGFQERAIRMKAKWIEKKKHIDEKEEKRVKELEAAAKKNALTCSFDFTHQDKERALVKLREAARLYDKSTPGAMSMKAFEVISMPPHVFKEQLRRVFNLKTTSAELGAYMDLFDPNNEGSINCSHFSKTFLAMGFEERSRENRESIEKQRAAEQARLEAHEKKQAELARKNGLKYTLDYTDEEHFSAMAKLLDAAWKYDKSMPGQPNLDAFDSQEMEPFIFQEQLKRAFYMKLSPAELGVLMDYFEADENGYIKCHNFLVKFSRLGFNERQLKSEQFRKHDLEMKEKRKLNELNKLQKAEEKMHIKTGDFNEKQFQTAMAKLTDAAIKYNSNGPGAVGLAAFEASHMQPHIFREQLKLAFGVVFTNNELSALMSYFDKENLGVIVCKDFIIQFFRTGFEERNRITMGYRAEDLRKKKKDKKIEEEKARIQALKSAKDVDYDFTESDFDDALHKLILTCFHFDRRQLGPAGFGAFTSESLTPSEFREMTKRTFNMKLSTYELGALVTYFDLHMKGVVHCTTFLNSFVQIRVQLEVYKGKIDEAEKIEAYHSQLKEVYKQRIIRIMLSGHVNLKPWKGNAPAIIHKGPETVSEKKAYPLTASEKINRRLQVGRNTGRLDLSTRAVKNLENGTYVTRLASRLKVVVKSETINDKIEFRLNSIPQEVFVLNILTELWFCNNNLTQIPTAIVSLECLQVLSFAHNFLTFLPVEILTLKFLKRLLLNGNRLSSLPDRFGELQCLEELELGHNLFTSIPSVLYEKCNQLVIIDFSQNAITEVPSGFIKMRSLTFLNLEKNKITAAPIVFQHMGWLDVKGCRLPDNSDFLNTSSAFIISDFDFDIALGAFLKNRANAKLNPKKKKRKERKSLVL